MSASVKIETDPAPVHHSPHVPSNHGKQRKRAMDQHPDKGLDGVAVDGIFSALHQVSAGNTRLEEGLSLLKTRVERMDAVPGGLERKVMRSVEDLKAETLHNRGMLKNIHDSIEVFQGSFKSALESLSGAIRKVDSRVGEGASNGRGKSTLASLEHGVVWDNARSEWRVVVRSDTDELVHLSFETDGEDAVKRFRQVSARYGVLESTSRSNSPDARPNSASLERSTTPAAPPYPNASSYPMHASPYPTRETPYSTTHPSPLPPAHPAVHQAPSDPHATSSSDPRVTSSSAKLLQQPPAKTGPTVDRDSSCTSSDDENTATRYEAVAGPTAKSNTVLRGRQMSFDSVGSAAKVKKRRTSDATAATTVTATIPPSLQELRIMAYEHPESVAWTCVISKPQSQILWRSGKTQLVTYKLPNRKNQDKSCSSFIVINHKSKGKLMRYFSTQMETDPNAEFLRDTLADRATVSDKKLSLPFTENFLVQCVASTVDRSRSAVVHSFTINATKNIVKTTNQVADKLYVYTSNRNKNRGEFHSKATLGFKVQGNSMQLLFMYFTVDNQGDT